MVFEAFRPRSTEIPKALFEELLATSPELADAVAKLEEEMQFGRDDPEDDSDQVNFVEEGEDYARALRIVTAEFDRLGARLTEDGIRRAVAQKMDPDGSMGFLDVL